MGHPKWNTRDRLDSERGPTTRNAEQISLAPREAVPCAKLRGQQGTLSPSTFGDCPSDTEALPGPADPHHSCSAPLPSLRDSMRGRSAGERTAHSSHSPAQAPPQPGSLCRGNMQWVRGGISVGRRVPGTAACPACFLCYLRSVPLRKTLPGHGEFSPTAGSPEKGTGWPGS